jgi:hypothetical protein
LNQRLGKDYVKKQLSGGLTGWIAYRQLLGEIMLSMLWCKQKVTCKELV